MDKAVRGDSSSVEHTFPLDMFQALRAFVRREEEQAVELHRRALAEGANAKICAEDLRRAQIHLNTCKALMDGAASGVEGGGGSLSLVKGRGSSSRSRLSLDEERQISAPQQPLPPPLLPPPSPLPPPLPS
jgi:hypothetical protein